MTTNLALVKEESKGLSIQSFSDLERLAGYIAQSGLIPQHLKGKPNDVAIILLKGSEMDLKPMQAIDSIDVIQGKPSIKPEAQLALIHQKFPDALVEIDQDPKNLSVTVRMARKRGDQPYVVTWDMARARAMGLDKKDNYLKQPLVMFKWRAVGEASRTVFPDVTRGLYNSEEATDFVPQGQAVASGIKAAFAKEEPKEEKVVESEVVNTTPESPEPLVLPPEAMSTSVLGEYVPAMKSWPKGKALKDISMESLKKFINTAKDFVAKNATAGPEWKEFVQVGQEYLATLEQGEPGFEEFSGPIGVLK